MVKQFYLMYPNENYSNFTPNMTIMLDYQPRNNLVFYAKANDYERDVSCFSIIIKKLIK